MPSNLQTAFLGFLTLRILNGIPQDQAGWIIKALARWIIDKEEPKPEEIPPECLGSWIAIREESVSIADRKKELAAFGRSGGRPASKPTENAPENAATESQGKPTESQGKPTQSQGKPTQSQGKQDEDVRIDVHTDDTDVPMKPRAPARETAADIGTSDVGTSDIGFLSENHHRSSDIGADATETPESRIKAVSWRAWAERLQDPVEAALDTTGETTAAARRTYGKRLKELGRARFLDTVESFAASLAEEPVRNRGAALTKQLGEAVAARRAMEALK